MPVIDKQTFDTYMAQSLKKWENAVQTNDMKEARNWFLNHGIQCGFCRIADLQAPLMKDNDGCKYCPGKLFNNHLNHEHLCNVAEWQEIMILSHKKDLSLKSYQKFIRAVKEMIRKIKGIEFEDYKKMIEDN